MSASRDDSFHAAMARLKSGDQSAAREIFERFVSRLIALAGTRLGGKLRRKIDPEDVVQSVFNSFFARQAKDQFRVANWDGLWGLLATITIYKCGHKIEHFQAACRDISGEISSMPMTREQQADWEAVAGDPSPAQLAILDETVVSLLADLDERDGQIFMLCLQGWSAAEIGGEVQCSERTVRRILERTRLHLVNELRGEK